MKKYFKYAYSAVAAVLALGFVACDSDDDYTPAAPEAGQQVYFSSEAPTTFTASAKETSFTVPVCRVATADAVTVPLTVTNPDGLFDVPTSVSFAAGQSRADLPISYDPEAVGFDKYSTITIAIADAQYTTQYGKSEFTFKAGIPAPWTSLGKGVFSENFWAGASFTVEIQQNDIDPQTYRLVKPFAQDKVNYDDNAPDYFEFRIYHAGETLLDQVLTQDIVYYKDVPIFNHPSYNDVINIVFPGRFNKYADQAGWTHNTVLAYAEDGTPGVVQMAPFYYMFNTGGWDQTQKDGIITIAFPGFKVSDFSLGLSYEGMLTKGAETSVLANVEFGEDIKAAQVCVVSEAELEVLEVEDITEGKVESVQVEESGAVQIPFANTEGGKFYIVGIGFDAEGEVQAVELAEFKVQAATGETWTKVASGTYTYYNLFEGDDHLDLYQSNANPTRYKIPDCFVEGYDFCFTLSSSGTVLLVDDQETGYVHDSYGMIYVDDCQDYFGAENKNGASYFDEESQTFYFSTLYYVPGLGSFGFSQPEPFVLDAEAAAAAPRLAASRSNGRSLSDSARQATRQQLRHNQKVERQALRF